MGFLSRAVGIRNVSMEDPAQPLLPWSALVESLGMGRSDAGVMVNEKQALRNTTAFGCVTIISSDLSALPLPVLQRMPDGSIREATDHRVYPILQFEPNENMTSMVFRSVMLAQVLGWGNSYTFIRRDRAARVVELVPLPSEKTTAVMLPLSQETGLNKKRLMYATTATADGMPAYIEPEDMLHIPGLSFDGYVGMSPIQTCKNAFGIALAAEKFGAQLFGNGAKASGVLSHPGQLGTEALENLKKSIREIITGENALRPLVLEEGMKWEQTTINPNDAQFLETRKFQREEIAALYRVPMHLLQSLERATNNNIEHQSLDYIRYCLRPWAVRIEQEINRKLLTGDFFVEHDFNAFQRGDFASQTAGFALLRNAAVYSANDILRALRQNPIPAAEGGDVRLAPLNMVPLKTLAKEEDADPAAEPAPTTDSDEGEPITDSRQARIVNAYHRLFRDAIGRIVNRKKRDEAFAYRALQPAIASMAEAIMAMYYTPDKEMKERAETESSSIARELAQASAEWKADQAGTIAGETANDVYRKLHKALIG
jgi:HK97 family phage portal protein